MVINTPKIWLIGGTVDSRPIVKALIDKDLPCVVTVTTTEAKNLYPVNSLVTLRVGSLAAENIPDFLSRENIKAIVDASHPFASQITGTVTEIATQHNIPYLRFERPRLPLGKNTVEVPDLATLLKGEYLHHQRVLLTLGTRWLSHFQPLQSQSTLFARILPYPQALEMAIAAGFTSDRIIALRPPIGESLEKALWQSWAIDVVITKASGAQGGELIKQKVAAALGTKLIRIARPKTAIGEITHDLVRIYQFCQGHLSP